MKKQTVLKGLGIEPPEVVFVEGECETKFEVNLKRFQCSCGAGRTEKCEHLKVAEDIYLRQGRSTRWAIYSAYHKACRRNDLERGLAWAHFLGKFTSQSCQINDISAKIKN